MSTDKVLNLDFLKDCFPKAQNVRTVDGTADDCSLHFTSQIVRCVVEYEEDGETQRRHLIAKLPISGRPVALVVEGLNLFERELRMYREVMPKVNKYLDKSPVPALLHVTDSRILIMEDLTARGFVSGEDLPPLNLDQSEAVLKALAHWHAASHKLYTEEPEFLQHLLALQVFGIETRMGSLGLWQPVMVELLKVKNEASLLSKVNAACAYLRRDDDQIRALVHKSNFKFVVLNHGDSRKENAMLSDSSEVLFIDLQNSLWSSPLIDFIYLVVTSVSMDVVEAHFDQLVDGYLLELNERLKKLECDGAYERADFDGDYRALRFFVFVCVLNLCYFLSTMDRLKLEDIFLNPEKDVDQRVEVCLKDEKFVQVIYGWLKYCEETKVFDFLDR